MEEKYYLIKAKTSWTYGHWFEDGNCWEESLLNDGVPPSAALINDRFSFVMTYQSQSNNKDNPGEIHMQSAVDQLQIDCGVVVGPSTSSIIESVSENYTSLPSVKHSMNRHACNICEKSFRWPSALVRHLQIHSGDKPFKCSQCDKSFTQKRTLNEHLSTHTGVKRFPCTHCSYRCSQRRNLIRHMRTHTRVLSPLLVVLVRSPLQQVVILDGMNEFTAMRNHTLAVLV